tara:strand:+ start:3591 stop:4361 length:771 start_codon:yes stop_codon:yes gene_type:complete
MIIVAVSGGKASAWCADWALKNHSKKDVTLYFNDTGWEHPDLYRFLDDLEKYLDHPILRDSDGRTPEEVFYDEKVLGNSRLPICSRTLKADRMQKYFSDGDTLIFGIGPEEQHRAKRIISTYLMVGEQTNKWAKIRFPLVAEHVHQNDVTTFIEQSGIETPLLYRLGFKHNNCYGGCVRQGKKSWKRLYDTLPDIYAERERAEEELRDYIGKDVHFLADETLKSFRGKIEREELGAAYYKDVETSVECIGICSTEA